MPVTWVGGGLFRSDENHTRCGFQVMAPDPTGSRAGAPRRRNRGVSSARTSALVLAVLVSVLAAGCSPAKLVESAALLADFNAGEGPSRLKQATPAPRRLLTTYEIEGRQRRGDLYLPGEDALANLVLVPGVTPEGKDDPRLVAFATTLARARFVVLVPDIENLRDIKVRSSDARDIGDAVLHLAGAGLAGAGSSVGVVAVSYAVGPAVLAALAEDTREQVRFLVAIGGYYDLQAMITFFTTGYYRDAPGRPWRPLRANAYGKWVFVKSNADRLRDPSDRAALTEMADRKLRDLAADIG